MNVFLAEPAPNYAIQKQSRDLYEYQPELPHAVKAELTPRMPIPRNANPIHTFLL
jgi:hypothetical protein